MTPPSDTPTGEVDMNNLTHSLFLTCNSYFRIMSESFG